MKLAAYTFQLSQTRRQRDLLLIGIIISMVLNMGLTGLSYKLSDQYRIVITPPVIDESFWIENRKVSSSYLQQMADYFSRLLLNTTAVSANNRREAVLSLVDNTSYASFQHLLLDEEEQIKKNNFITMFTPAQFNVDVERLTVEVIGELSIFQGKQQVKNNHKTYKLKFSFSGKSGKLLVKGFEDVTKEA